MVRGSRCNYYYYLQIAGHVEVGGRIGVEFEVEVEGYHVAHAFLTSCHSPLLLDLEVFASPISPLYGLLTFGQREQLVCQFHPTFGH